MPEPIEVANGVVVPAEAITFRALRSSGPGGQNVNKVASKVELRVDLDRITGLDAAARERLLVIAEPRRGADGLLVVTSQRTRDQHRNLEDAREKVRGLVALALVEPVERVPTRRTPAGHERRLGGKRRRAERKRTRGPVPTED